MNFTDNIVKNYSTALFRNISPNSKEADISQNLKTMIQIINDNSSLKCLMQSLAVSSETKIRILHSFAKKHKFGKISQNFLNLLAKNSRFYLLESVSRAFDDLIAKNSGTKFAEITSTSKLDKEAISNIKKFLENRFSIHFELSNIIDSTIIGGVTIEYDSFLLDCSIKGAISRFSKLSSTLIA